MTRCLKFVRLEEKTFYENEDDFREKFFSTSVSSHIETKSKDRLYMILADCYGVPYLFEISKPFKKYSSGKVRTTKMIGKVSQEFENEVFILNESGSVENLDKIIKSVMQRLGY